MSERGSVLNTPENNREFIRIAVVGSKLVKLTKDRQAVFPKAKFDMKKAKEQVEFVIAVEGPLPERNTLEEGLRTFGKLDGVYVKSFNEENHLIYVGYLKPRYREAFKDAFNSQQVPIFDSTHTSLLSLSEADKARCRAKKLAGGYQNPDDDMEDEKVEVLELGSFIKLTGIPKDTQKYRIRDLFDTEKPKYIDYSNEEHAIIRFWNPQD